MSHYPRSNLRSVVTPIPPPVPPSVPILIAIDYSGSTGGKPVFYLLKNDLNIDVLFFYTYLI